MAQVSGVDVLMAGFDFRGDTHDSKPRSSGHRHRCRLGTDRRGELEIPRRHTRTHRAGVAGRTKSYRTFAMSTVYRFSWWRDGQLLTDLDLAVPRRALRRRGRPADRRHRRCSRSMTRTSPRSTDLRGGLRAAHRRRRLHCRTVRAGHVHRRDRADARRLGWSPWLHRSTSGSPSNPSRAPPTPISWPSPSSRRSEPDIRPSSDQDHPIGHEPVTTYFRGPPIPGSHWPALARENNLDPVGHHGHLGDLPATPGCTGHRRRAGRRNERWPSGTRLRRRLVRTRAQGLCHSVPAVGPTVRPAHRATI